MDILIVSQMYPGAENPDLGIFVQGQENVLRQRGHNVRVVAVTRRKGGLAKHFSFALRTIASVLWRRPQVVYAHFLAPAGVLATLACRFLPRTVLVVVAHGRDVRNIGERRGMQTAMRILEGRADHVVAVSQYLANDLEQRVPKLAGKVHVIDAGVDVKERFTPAIHADARRKLGELWNCEKEEPAFLFVGTLDERKNVLRLAEAFERLEQGSLTIIGDGPLRSKLEGRPRVQLVGRVSHDEVVTWMRACDVLCLPSLIEPFGQVLIEAMACERSVLATKVGGPPEFVSPSAGVLVDPESIDDIERGLRAVAELPSPNLAARAVALGHDVHSQVARIETLMRESVEQRKQR